MLESVYATLSSNLGLWHHSKGKASPRTGNRHGGLAEPPYNAYPTFDGYAAVLCVGERNWNALLRAMGREELVGDPRFADLKNRVANMSEVDQLVLDFTNARTRNNVCEILREYRIPCAPVRDLSELVQDPELHQSRFLAEVDHPDFGELTLPRSPMRYSSSKQVRVEPSGELGRNNSRIYGELLNLHATELEQLRHDGVI